MKLTNNNNIGNKKMTQNAKTATLKGAKAKKLTATEQSKQVRKRNARKVITVNIRKIEKIRTVLEKATSVIGTEASSLNGDISTQMADILGKLNMAITVTNAEIETQANALAKTFLA